MSLTVEIILRVPSLTVRTGDSPRSVNNTLVRFRRRIEVPVVPAVGSVIELHTASGIAFEATVSRRDWSDVDDFFVVTCTFAARRIAPETYQAIVDDPSWIATDLPA